MEAIKFRLNAIAWFLTALLLFQSCVVYHKTPTTLEKASQERIKTKITNIEEDTFKYKYITFEEGQFYGVYEPEELGEFVKDPIEQKNITRVQTKNKTASTLITVLVIAVPVLGIVVISAVNSISYDYGGGI